MKQKISSVIILLILILPIVLYAVFKNTPNNAAIAAVKNKPVVIEFYTPLCSECQKLKPVLDKVEPKYNKKVEFKKINANTFDRSIQEQVMKYDVKVVPTMVFINKDGSVAEKTTGSMSEEMLENKIDEILK